MSGIVTRKVADHLKGRGESDLTGPRPGSLDASVSRISGTAPLWQLLSAGHPRARPHVANCLST